MAKDYEEVVNWLTQQGFIIWQKDSGRMAIFATGPISALQTQFGMNFARVTADGVECTAATTPPAVPADIASKIVGVNGLQPFLTFHKHSIRVSTVDSVTASYQPSQIAQAYDATSLYTAGVMGTNETIAIVIDTFPNQSDLATFWSDFNINRGPSTVSFIQVISGKLATPSGEESLDTEWSTSIAPNANVRVYASRKLSTVDIDACYQRVESDVLNNPSLNIHEMTMSYGIGEAYVSASELNTEDAYFVKIAAAGVTLFASSGDVGATPTMTGTASGSETPEYPASDPNVAGVGGTTLTLDSSNNISSEIAWNNDTGMAPGATGGGVSPHFSRPSWQTGPTVDGASSVQMRLVPDIASSADPYYGAYVVLNGSLVDFGRYQLEQPNMGGDRCSAEPSTR